MKKKIIIGAGILIVIVIAIVYFLSMTGGDEQYNTVEVERGTIEKFIEETGEIRSKNIRSYYGNGANKVENVHVEIGEDVNEEDILLEYNNNIDIEIQKINKQIEALEATYNEAISGADFEQINTAKLEIESVKDNIEIAQENKNRIENLYENQATTKQELDEANNRLEQLQNSLKIAQSQYNLLVKDLSQNMKNKYEAEIEVLALSLKILEENKENYYIKTGFQGIVTELDTFEGDIPLAGKKILEIQDPSEIRVFTDLIIEDAIEVKKNMDVEIYNEDLDLDLKNLKIEKIYPKAYSKLSDLGIEQKRVTIEIVIPKVINNIPFGAKITTRVNIESKNDILYIPEEAVYEKNMKKYVEVLENGEVKEREVKLGIENDDHIEIIEGLKEGEKIIID